jgi:tyrosine-specific transport protein
MNNSFVLALSTLIGTTIGAGIFGLPYVVSQSGVVSGVFLLLLLGGVVTLLHLLFGEITLRTKAKHRLIGYAEMYLGGWAKKLVTVSTIAGVVGALLAYIIIAGDFFHIIVSEFIEVPQEVLSIVVWAALSAFILRGIQAIAQMELFMNIALFSVIGVIFLFAAPHVKTDNFISIDFAHAFLPYGVILFAFAGWAAIPEIADFFKKKKEKQNLDNLIVASSAIVGTVYLLFILFVVGVSGYETTQDALLGLAPFLGKGVVVLGALFGLVAIAASFLVLGNYLKNSLRYDYKLSYPSSVAIAVVTPLVLFLLGFREFIAVIGTVGAFVGVVEGAVIVFVYKKAKQKGDREPEYSLRVPHAMLIAVVLLLLAGAVAELSSRL